jgi:siroheme synthase-like protein
MAYFPFFMDVSQGEGLIVGGGTVALRKARKLQPYEAKLTLCAPEFLPELEEMEGLTLLHRPFTPALLEGKLFVIAATDDRDLNHTISALCREKNIPVNVVDDRDYCTFLFPALVKRGDLSIGISTGGASPTGAVYWKERFNAQIPADFGELLAYLDGLREPVKAAIPQEKDRARCFARLFEVCMEKGWPLEKEDLQKLGLCPGEEDR